MTKWRTWWLAHVYENADLAFATRDEAAKEAWTIDAVTEVIEIGAVRELEAELNMYKKMFEDARATALEHSEELTSRKEALDQLRPENERLKGELTGAEERMAEWITHCQRLRAALERIMYKLYNYDGQPLGTIAAIADEVL